MTGSWLAYAEDTSACDNGSDCCGFTEVVSFPKLLLHAWRDPQQALGTVGFPLSWRGKEFFSFYPAQDPSPGDDDIILRVVPPQLNRPKNFLKDTLRDVS